MDVHIAKRNCSFVLYGGQDEYENFMKVKEWVNTTPEVQSSPEYHSFDLDPKIEFITKQVRLIAKFLGSQGGLRATAKQLPGLYSILGIEAQRPFQASYLFTHLLRTFFKGKESQDILQDVDSVRSLGTVLLDENDYENRRSTSYQFDPITTKLHNGSVSTGSAKSGIFVATHLIDYAIVLGQDGERPALALVRLRNEKGELLEGVKLKWLGKSLELVNNWAIELTNVKAVQVFHLNNEDWKQRISIATAPNSLLEARNQLQDVLRLTYLSKKYCSMRRQFKTLDEDTKNERRVIEYQVTTHRIIAAVSFAVSHLIGLDSLSSKFELGASKPEGYAYSVFVRLYAQQTIQRGFELIEILRETMGGYGFLRFSGAPTIQERALWLYQQLGQHQEATQTLLLSFFHNHQQNQIFVNGVQGMITATHPEKMLEEVGKIDEASVTNPFSLFGFYGAKIRLSFMKAPESINALQAQQYTQNIVTTFVGIQFFYYLAFRRHRVANEILDKVFLHSVQSELIKIEENPEYRQHILKSYPQIQLDLLSNLDVLLDSLDFDGTFFDAQVGQENEDDFYRQLIDWAKNKNLRNDPKTREYIIQDVRAYIQRPSL